MATFTDAKKLAAHQRARERRRKFGRTSMDAASAEAAAIAKREAERLTAGAVRADGELAAAGHPFRKARLLGLGQRIGGVSLVGAYPLLPIGRQKNRVQRGWRVFKQNNGSYRLQNISPVAKFVLAPGGTKRMVDRGFWVALNRVVVPKVRAKRLELTRLALKG